MAYDQLVCCIHLSVIEVMSRDYKTGKDKDNNCIPIDIIPMRASALAVPSSIN